MNEAAQAALRDATLPKGDALVTAQVAGIMAAKHTARSFRSRIRCRSTRSTCASSGAATAVARRSRGAHVGANRRRNGGDGRGSVAALTIYDMPRRWTKASRSKSVRLLEARREERRIGPSTGHRCIGSALIVLSDRAASGERADVCIPVMKERLGGAYAIVRETIFPTIRRRCRRELIDLADSGAADLVLTSGGTGLSPRDRTPQATAAILDYEVPGIARSDSLRSFANVKTAMLSRALAGVRHRTLIVNLPGKPESGRGVARRRASRPCRTRSSFSADGSSTDEPHLERSREAQAYLLGTIDEVVRRAPPTSSTACGRCSRELGDPHRAYPTIHVGGTSGKGSTCTMVAAALQAAGKRTGLHTKPHCGSMTERARIDGVADFERSDLRRCSTR